MSSAEESEEEESGVVRAEDLAPAAYADEAEGDKYADLECDLRLLAAFDTHPIDKEALSQGKEKYLVETAQKTVQELVKKLFSLPTEMSDGGPLALLPKHCTYVLPREKPVPVPKPLTKWEKFAREKGITKKKKDRMIWDETKKEWAPRWGYKKANAEANYLVELKDGQSADDSLFKGGSETNRAKNQANRSKNLQNAQKDGYVLPTGIAPELMTRSGTAQGILTKKQRGKAGTAAALQAVQQATASMSKFDIKRRGEPERKIANKRRKFSSNTGSWGDEKSRTMDVLTRVLNPNGLSRNKNLADSGNKQSNKDAKADRRQSKQQLKKKGKHKKGTGKKNK